MMHRYPFIDSGQNIYAAGQQQQQKHSLAFFLQLNKTRHSEERKKNQTQICAYKM